jgi:uncharacterized LabA/DUF88 family protein
MPHNPHFEARMTEHARKIAVFIDGPNLYAAAKALGFDIDFKRLLKEFQERGTLVRALYYTPILEHQEFLSFRPLVDWLDYNGYTIVTKATEGSIDAAGRRRFKGNMGIEIAVDAMELAPQLTRWCCVPAMVVFVAWWKPCNAAASG